jgi:bacterioferritin
MKGNDKVIELLNKARASELTAIMTYMAQHYELEDQDLGVLADIIKKTAIVEMKHAEKLAERILFLEGAPVTLPDRQIVRGQDLQGMLKTDMDLEMTAIRNYNDFARQCGELGDHVSKVLFEELLAQEEGHQDEFENIKDHLDKLGNDYIARLTGHGNG